MVCHRFMATNQVSSFLRQLRSRTSFDLSPPRAEMMDCNRSEENLPSGKRKDVMMTYSSAVLQCSIVSVRRVRCFVGKEKEKEKEKSHLLRPLVNPIPRIPIINTPCNLKPSGPRSQCLLGSFIISRSQHDDMTPAHVMFSVQRSIVTGRKFWDVIGF